MKPRTALTLLVLLGLSACADGDDVRIRLTSEQRDRYQAIAAAKLDSLRPILDSICVTTFEDRVAIATDSIVQRRLEEERRLRSRIEQTEGR